MEKHRTLPTHIRQAIIDVKREHPPLGINEIRTSCWARFAHRPRRHRLTAAYRETRAERCASWRAVTGTPALV